MCANTVQRLLFDCHGFLGVHTRACACVCMCNLSSKPGAASTNLMTSICRVCPELTPMAPAMDAQPIKLGGQVLRMISINGITDNKASGFNGVWVFALILSCSVYL